MRPAPDWDGPHVVAGYEYRAGVSVPVTTAGNLVIGQADEGHHRTYDDSDDPKDPDDVYRRQKANDQKHYSQNNHRLPP